MNKSKTFVLIGAAGYIAPRHMKAIKDNGHTLVAAYDPFDSVGIIDSYFPEADFFTEFERFDRHIEKLAREGNKIDFVSVCSPNYLHDAHIRFGLRIGANVICEKPIVLNPWNLDALIELESESKGKVYSVLQLRLHEKIMALKESVSNRKTTIRSKIDLTYLTSRGKWYHHSWKGDKSKSGGIATNIGVHFFDMLIWIFGEVEELEIVSFSDLHTSGKLKLKNADVNWTLGIDYEMIPEEIRKSGARTYRTLDIDGDQFEFSQGFTELHTKTYEDILNGQGYGLKDTKLAIDLVKSIRDLCSKE